MLIDRLSSNWVNSTQETAMKLIESAKKKIFFLGGGGGGVV